MKPQTEAQFKAAVTRLEKGTASDTERALIRAMIYAPLSPAEAALIKDPETEAKLRAAAARLKAEKADADEIFVHHRPSQYHGKNTESDRYRAQVRASRTQGISWRCHEISSPRISGRRVSPRNSRVFRTSVFTSVFRGRCEIYP
jgi:hypothetical protein